MLKADECFIFSCFLQAYYIKGGSKGEISYLPLKFTLTNGRCMRLERYRAEDHESAIFSILKEAVDEGQTYPQDTMETMDDFRAFYVSHDVFVAVEEETDEAVGSFYVKPNFPGLCSHVCNGGFLVRRDKRRQGISHFLGQAFLTIARDLGYKSSLFNLVFVSNTASIHMCKSMGLIEVGRIPEVGNLKGLGYTDAIMFYLNFSTLPQGLPQGMTSLQKEQA